MKVFKKWWFWLIVVIVVIGSLAFNEEDETEEVKPKEEQQDAAEKDPKENKENESDISWDDVKEQDRIVGKSDKDFTEVANNKPTEVRDDKTGNWRITKISSDIDIEEYALSYSKEHMGEDEVHFIVNFTRNTTAWLNELGGLLYVDIREYVDREEHNAADLGSGMVLKSYVIYPDGDIQELEE